MRPNDVFTLDELALAEVSAFTKQSLSKVKEKLSVGDTFSVAKKEDCAGAVIQASRWDTDENGVGKPRIGRPRRFPRGTVERLLGEEVTIPVVVQVATEEAASEAEEVDLEAEAEALLNDEVTTKSNDNDRW